MPDHKVSGRNPMFEGPINDGRISVPENKIIEFEGQKDDLIEMLRKEALALSPKHGDKLYPLEVLGVYNRVLNSKSLFDLTLLGNPEEFIDDRITKWVMTFDKSRFSNRLERVLTQNKLVNEIFYLRLNYALLMEEGEDEIKICKRQVGKLTFTDSLDEEGNYTGNLSSSFDIDDKKLDEMANDFYSQKRKIKSTKTGVKKSLRIKILDKLNMVGYIVNNSLNEVYNLLRSKNEDNMEEGLIARIAYLVLVSEIDHAQLSIEQELKTIEQEPKTIEQKPKIEQCIWKGPFPNGNCVGQCMPLGTNGWPLEYAKYMDYCPHCGKPMLLVQK